MAEQIENLVLEHLKAIRMEMAANTKALEGLTLRVGSLEEHIAGMRRDLSLLHGDLAITHKRIDDVDQRLGRVERRLELVG
ncbi:hypothetical protein [Chitinimonas koreensis]|uniref:hypothetical protein n=1 Tax=Chitinimonas koreensis TaxID=356302 RepID=UPI00041F590D|nr:hypothetical protein [Chitinimonas koreensis]QNM97824.1 hypothetical protein H9L41_06010 [Chitinimonas koreensis]